DLRSLLVDLPLEAVDELVTALDDVQGSQTVHPHDEHVLVMRAIEDADLADVREATADPPQEAMAFFLGGRLLQGCDLDRLRVQGANSVCDGAVLVAWVNSFARDRKREPSR